jgi:hypothetical protein
MLNNDPWLTFPPHLTPPTIRSLSLCFILQEITHRFEQIERLKVAKPEEFTDEICTFFSLDSPYPKIGICPDKLCFYSDILVQASRIRDESLQQKLNDMRASILQCRSKLFLKNTNELSTLSSFFSDFQQKLSSFFFAITPFLHEAKTDENVLLKLIEHRQTLNTYLGLNAIEKLLNEFFPTGLDHLRAIISEGLTRRGFSSFLLEKESLIDSIRWESPCLMTHK